MNGYPRYRSLITKWVPDHTIPILEAVRKGEQIPSIKETDFYKVFKGFTEISDTIEALNLTYIFISLQPPKSKRVSRPDYLKYHVGVYLHEIYILKERLKSYATKIQRAYSKGAKNSPAYIRIETLIKFVTTELSNPVHMRGTHVHETRYGDEDLNLTSAFAILAEDNHDFNDTFQLSYELAKSKWKNRIKEQNDATMKILDHYFDELFTVITNDGVITLP